MSERWLPNEETIEAMAEACHNGNDLCNANYYVPFELCDMAEADRRDATEVLIELRSRGWLLTRDPGHGARSLGL